MASRYVSGRCKSQAKLDLGELEKFFWPYPSFGLLHSTTFIPGIVFKEKYIIIVEGFFEE